MDILKNLFLRMYREIITYENSISIGENSWIEANCSIFRNIIYEETA